jgi:neurotrimin
MLIQYNFSLIADMPKFAESIQNVTVTVGREATLTCVVDDLGSYKVSIYVPQALLFWAHT